MCKKLLLLWDLCFDVYIPLGRNEIKESVEITQDVQTDTKTGIREV